MSQPLQSSDSYFCSYPYPNPNLNLNQITPPGVDPYSFSVSVSAQPQYHQPQQQYPYYSQNTDALPPHPNQPTYTTGVDNLMGANMDLGMCPSYGNFSWDSQYLNQYVVQTTTTKPVKVAPTFRCEVCNIVCNCKDTLDKHNQGRKHLKNLEKQARAIHNSTMGQMVDTSGVVFAEELEKKKQLLLNNGVPVSSLLFCTICNIVCSDEGVFGTHLAGKKHAKQVAKQASAAQPAPPNPVSVATPSSQPLENAKELEPVKRDTQPIHCDLCGLTCDGTEYFEAHLAGQRHAKNLKKLEKTNTLKDKNGDIKIEGEILQKTEKKANAKVEGENVQKTASTRCEVCNITCTSLQVLNTHLLGKKHKKNLVKVETEKFIGPLVGPATPQIIGPTTNPSVAGMQIPQNGAKRFGGGSYEDLETKRVKIMGEGATPDFVKGVQNM